jgi:peptidyl-prolyl isomerase H (cyclophilin H)
VIDLLDSFFVLLISGRVIEGMLIVRKIENVPVALNSKPKIPVIISQCGEM